MVHFVRFSQADQVLVIGVFEPLNPLVNQDIMYHEITKSVKCDPESDEKQIVHAALYAKVKKSDAGCCENHKKDIVSFENVGIFGLVMIGMEIPHRSVHNVLVSHPSHAFHEKEDA